MKTIKKLSILALSSVVFFSCETNKKEKLEIKKSEEIAEVITVTESDPNIVEVAAGNENFSTLVAAVKAADLASTLSGKGPFTVFAPTNDAFNKLPESTVETLLKSENKEKLTGILTYHVVVGKYEASAVIDAIKKNKGTFKVTTVQGGEITLILSNGNVMLKDATGGMATVIMADVAASNGVIHAIDTVVMPK